MKKTKKSVIAFAVFAASAIVAVGAPLAQSTFAATSNTCHIGDDGSIESDSLSSELPIAGCKATNRVEVIVGEVLTIDVENAVVALNPIVGTTEDGIANGDTGTSDVTVSTNWAHGASLSVSMNGANTYLEGTGTNTETIAATSATTLSDNTWGYQAYPSGTEASGNWAGMPAAGSATTIFDESGQNGMSVAGSSTWTFKYGAKINYQLPGDTYSGEVLYTATTNQAPSE